MEEKNKETLTELENTKEEKKETTDVQKDTKQNMEKSKKKNIVIVIVVVIVIVILSVLAYKYYQDNFAKKETVETEKTEVYKSKYMITSNSLEPFDLYFLQLENNGANKVYSPLSIKYALEMLGEGANGNTKAQIDSVIGDYKAKKYVNSANMSFANAMFIKNNYKDNVKKEYTNKLSSKYNAEIIYDSFQTADNVNNWVSNKTFNLINDLFDNVSDNNFILINALAIDMEWKNVFQHETENYYVAYQHENFASAVRSLDLGYPSFEFNNNKNRSKAVEIAADANKYDIVKALGEDNIRETVGKKYEEWLAQGACGSPETEPDVNTYLDNYIEELNSNYGHISSSTDFYFYDDEEVKVFAKDLKEYNNTTLEYVGIMPKVDSLEQYIKETDAEKVNTLISNLKEIKLENFEDGVITKIEGKIPLFKIDYELKLMDDLKELGITDVFDITKADLTGIASAKDIFVDSAVHKANIEFSNEGIKAAAATVYGGKGAASCGFDYKYEVPIEVIDLTFDKPYLYLIRDKETGEVWFIGTVYEPIEYSFYY